MEILPIIEKTREEQNKPKQSQAQHNYEDEAEDFSHNIFGKAFSKNKKMWNTRNTNEASFQDDLQAFHLHRIYHSIKSVNTLRGLTKQVK
ncbi:CLUMA_CG001967, isoform A [Clunio marinus]|uniref:CLUMA_CG001967, isoform A n=1 Tax=Clunio marinus TaxID=568069 RepID=A0A1J1HKX5_9DIPT|nr:CLUMA_CG001967, isoform A [Clunio marinus]